MIRLSINSCGDTLSHAPSRGESRRLGVTDCSRESEHKTYADLATEAKRLAAALRDRGLKDGDGYHSADRPDFYRVYFGISSQAVFLPPSTHRYDSGESIVASATEDVNGG